MHESNGRLLDRTCMSDDIHPDDFGGTDEDSQLVPKRLPDLDHVGPLQSGSLRPFVGVDPLTGGATTFADGRMHVGVDEHTASLIADYQADQATMARLGALTRWLDTSARSFEEAIALGQAAGLDTDHAQRLATIAGFKQVTIVRFEADVDADATRIAAVLGALGYTATRVMADQGGRDRWALAELARRCSLSASEAERANQVHAAGEIDGYATTYIDACICHKLDGKTLAQAMAEIAEVRS